VLEIASDRLGSIHLGLRTYPPAAKQPSRQRTPLRILGWGQTRTYTAAKTTQPTKNSTQDSGVGSNPYVHPPAAKTTQPTKNSTQDSGVGSNPYVHPPAAKTTQPTNLITQDSGVGSNPYVHPPAKFRTPKNYKKLL
jgi:hypothetical protein